MSEDNSKAGSAKSGSPKAAQTRSDAKTADNDADKSKRIRQKISASEERMKRDTPSGSDERTGASSEGGSRSGARAAKTRAAANANDTEPSTARKVQRTLFDTIEEHPFAVLAGGLAIGMIAASILPGSIGRRMGRRAAALAAVAGELGLAYGSRALDLAADAGRRSSERLEDLTGVVSESSADARRRAADLAETAFSSAREASESAFRRMSELANRSRH